MSDGSNVLQSNDNDLHKRFTIPRWKTRRGKIFYIRLLCLAIGLILVTIAWSNESDLRTEIAATFMGVAIGTIVADSIVLGIPCKKRIKIPAQ